MRRALGGGLGCLDGGTARVADPGADRATPGLDGVDFGAGGATPGLAGASFGLDGESLDPLAAPAAAATTADVLAPAAGRLTTSQGRLTPSQGRRRSWPRRSESAEAFGLERA